MSIERNQIQLKTIDIRGRALIPEWTDIADITALTDEASGKVLTSGGIGNPPLWDATPAFESLALAGNGSGALSIGGGTYSHVVIAVGIDDGRANKGNPLADIHEVAFYTALRGNSSASGAGSFVGGFEAAIGTQPGVFTLDLCTNYSTGNMTKGAGTTITRTVGFGIYDETAGLHNASIGPADGPTFTGNWFINYPGGRDSLLGTGLVTMGAATLTTAGAGAVNFRMFRSGAVPTDWFVYIPAGATTLNFYASGDRMVLDAGGFLTLTGINMGAGGYLQGTEMTAPSAPAADGFRIYAQDNGGGKTQLMVKFNSGAAQQLAIQP